MVSGKIMHGVAGTIITRQPLTYPTLDTVTSLLAHPAILDPCLRWDRSIPSADDLMREATAEEAYMYDLLKRVCSAVEDLRDGGW